MQQMIKGKRKEKWRYSKNEETKKKVREILKKERKSESKKRMNTDSIVANKIFLPKIKNTNTTRLLEATVGESPKQGFKMVNGG